MKDDAIEKDEASCELSDEKLNSVAGGGCDDNYNEKRQDWARVRLLQCRCWCDKEEPVGTVVRVDGDKICIDPDCCHEELHAGKAGALNPRCFKVNRDCHKGDFIIPYGSEAQKIFETLIPFRFSLV